MKRPLETSLKRMRALVLGTTALTGALAMSSSASADTLIDALTAAYQSNPTLQAQRADLRATDELVPQALSGWRPSVEAQGSVGRTKNEVTATFSNSGIFDPRSASVTLNQNLYAGGRTLNATRQAEFAVLAGREGLAGVEQQTLLTAVQSYMDVIRDEGVVALNQNNVTVLRRQLEATQDRFRVGELTRTDVAQSEARLSLARSNLIAAEAQLTASRAFYSRVVGQAPGTLERPARLETLPATEDEARELAAQNNPTLMAARHTEMASYRAVSVAKGALLPSFDVQARYQYARDPSTTVRDVEESSILGVLTIPLYQSGAEYSRVREAKEINNRNRLEVAAALRQVDEAVRIAWEQLRASQAGIISTGEQVNASEIALEGVRQESEVGARTTLDVLDAEQELLNARVTLVSAERDLAVSEYNLLAATGQLTARQLQLPVEYYDPEVNYGEVRNKWIGFGTAGDE
ncbi:MAG: hypothetical protein CVT72_15160 [Alphaproteobacteria bacterium HGW-Alphaproteobacteria-11]|nr:MAG: hypothetical protein CVT72_15160 [Alphaproteobacteria bacterium HGW-Alphaproteobacteria-11]